MKKRLSVIVLLCILSLLFISAGCKTTGGAAQDSVAAAKAVDAEPAVEKVEQDVDAVAHATPKGDGWMFTVEGVRSDEVWESNFEKWKEDPSSGYCKIEFDRKDEAVSFGAMPLKNIIAMIDDADATMPYSFIEDKWTAGYDITFTSSDGYSVTINTADYSAADFYLADMVDGENITPMLTGNVSSQIWVKDIAGIKASLQALSLEDNDFELVLEIEGRSGSYTISELENLDYYVEEKGNYTNSYDNTFEFLWGGVKIVELINEYTTLTDDMSLIIEAMDGYAMNYSTAQLLDNSDGDWILAFKEDGAYMPEDPGYIRLVKVGPGNPNFESHASAKMIKKIIIEDVAFRDFQLEIIDGDKVEIMDRQTVQSGVTTWRTVVDYYNTKADETVRYLGMPVYEVLRKYSGYDTVRIVAEDGFEISLAAEELAGNDDVIIAMFYGDESELSADEFPLIIVWDEAAAVVPAGIKPVKNISKIIVE